MGGTWGATGVATMEVAAEAMTMVAVVATSTLRRVVMVVAEAVAAMEAPISTTPMVEVISVEAHPTRAIPEAAAGVAWVLRVAAETWVQCTAWAETTITRVVADQVVAEAVEDTLEAAEATIMLVDQEAKVSRITRP